MYISTIYYSKYQILFSIDACHVHGVRTEHSDCGFNYHTRIIIKYEIKYDMTMSIRDSSCRQGTSNRQQLTCCVLHRCFWWNLQAISLQERNDDSSFQTFDCYIFNSIFIESWNYQTIIKWGWKRTPTFWETLIPFWVHSLGFIRGRTNESSRAEYIYACYLYSVFESAFILF